MTDNSPPLEYQVFDLFKGAVFYRGHCKHSLYRGQGVAGGCEKARGFGPSLSARSDLRTESPLTLARTPQDLLFLTAQSVSGSLRRRTAFRVVHDHGLGTRSHGRVSSFKSRKNLSPSRTSRFSVTLSCSAIASLDQTSGELFGS